MRKILFFTLITIFSYSFLTAQVIVDDTGEKNPTPHPSAILELKSTTKGFLPPRLTKAEREAIQNPAEGLMIYLIEDGVRCLQVYDRQGWTDVYCPSTNKTPIAQDVTITGTPVIGNTLVGSYTYFDEDGDKEDNSIYNWYTIDTPQDTNYVSLNNNSNSLVLTNEHDGKYIVFGVTPKALSGAIQGNESYSTPIGKVGDNTTVASEANINELHYDNVSGDINEFVEIRVKGDVNNQPTNINSFKVIQYRSTGTIVSSETLGNLVKTCDQSNCYYVWSPSSLQNGTIGLALITNDGSVAEFISYEGIVTGTEGEASGYTSTDIGVSQSSSTPVDSSLFLDSDGTWKVSNGSNTKGTANY